MHEKPSGASFQVQKMRPRAYIMRLLTAYIQAFLHAAMASMMRSEAKPSP